MGPNLLKAIETATRGIEPSCYCHKITANADTHIDTEEIS
jgi:hypothetical protein